MKHQHRALRIIGGKWRGRKVRFPDQPDIRPTGDRIRETLFNWLMHDITGYQCLDLYAGSGILGIEALSRGASEVTFVETDPTTVGQLQRTLTDLDTGRGHIRQTPATEWLSGPCEPVDIIFLDPPFDSDELSRVCEIIDSRSLSRHYVYIESGEPGIFEKIPASWTIHRKKRAGSVHYGLVETG